MKNLLHTEFGKSLKSRFFRLSIAIGVVVVVVGAVQAVWAFYFNDFSVINTRELLAEKGDYIGQQTLYNSWIGGNRQSIGGSLFFTLTPILAALTCGWSFSEEIHSGYLHMILVRRGRAPYFLAKMAVGFVTGGLAVLIPQLISIVLTAVFIPATPPKVLWQMYYGVSCGQFLSVLFYTHPLLYTAVILGVDFAFGGVFSWLSMATAFFSRSRTAALLLPFLGLEAAGMCQSLFSYFINYSIAPLDMLHPQTANNIVTAEGVLLWLGVLAVFGASIIMVRGWHREIL